ncbi:hypothetical protein MZM54_04500 [[Brevibacterium] frigoritolerans]|nr:hypothetical protein [Peribacillus frigoritolerans]
MYSSYFNGWIGKMDETWNKENREQLFSNLFNYYHKNLLSGQKIFIGFDHNQSSKYMAIEASNFFSQNGIAVFISNRPLTTSMLQVITKERYGCGSLSFVCDDHSFPYVGLKASNTDGVFINNKNILVTDKIKMNKKQPVDWFDPILNLKNYIKTNFEIEKDGKAINSLVWNAMHSPLSPVLEEIFIEVTNKKSIDGYTINSFEHTLTKDTLMDYEIQEQIEFTELKMNEYLCQFGVTTSPDLSKIDLLNEKEGKLLPIPLENIISRIIPYLKHKENIIISDDISFRKQKNFTLDIVKIPDAQFLNEIQNNSFSIAIDGNYNIYLQNEAFPNQFATLFCLFHSFIFSPATKESLKKKTIISQTEETKI